MKKPAFIRVLMFSATAFVISSSSAFAQQPVSLAAEAEASAVRSSAPQQSNVPAEVRQAEDAVERAARRFRLGVSGGVGLDPELIMFGLHGAFGPFFTRGLEVRRGVESGLGEVTTW